ncbi:MAG TPA: aspartate kinase [Bacteroidia bacterium]|nr:aspartate kinase [Bacteroidia bacterium]
MSQREPFGQVLKFGGTSVGSAERMKEVAKLVNYPGKKIVVLSAMAGTTDQLVKITKALYAHSTEDAGKLLKELEPQYRATVDKLFTSEEYKLKGNEIITQHFNLLWSFTLDMFTHNEEKTILAEGELLSTALFHYYLEEQKVPSILLPALNFMRIDEEGEPDLDYIEEHLKKELAKNPHSELFITQGYICRNPFGQIDNLKRGGSDYTASLIGAAITAEEIQIWTDIDGMHNNDPRFVPNTFPIAELSFDEAAELAYFGAKILHPYCIRPAKKRNVPVRLLNTMKPQAKGTLISRNASGDSIKAVAAKDKITVIKIKSDRMLMAYGFLRSVFEVFERYKTPIDVITTSEVAVSLTIDDNSHIDDIIKELEIYGTVNAEMNQVIICIVGDFLADKHGYALMIFASLKDIPIRMISYGGSKNNISILVNAEHKKDALLALNKGLFTKNK